MTFAVGSLVEARGREWVVLPESTDDFLVVRPLSGTEAEVTGIATDLEEVRPAVFDLPDPSKPGDYRSARLLRDALQLGFRSTAGPFRSLGHINVDPRPYQLVPLLMALRQDTVRVLIADDVGIGKTVEAALIARELLDTGDIRRLAVLCPPHLAEQWQGELSEKFHIEAELVLSSTAARLERHLPQDRTIFDEHPYVVVSTDFIKSDRRRDEFLRTAPEFVIVDEAHTCVEQSGGRGSHQRHRLVKGLAQDAERHLVLVTATPHSGKTDAFRSLIGLLDPTFLQFPENLGGEHNRRNRERLAEHLVQRRRQDILAYESDNPFPQREEATVTYELSPKYGDLFDRVLNLARETVSDTSGDERQDRIRWWSVLGLLRALASSPAAAAATMRTRSVTADAESTEEADALGQRFVLDVGDDELDTLDTVPGAESDDDRLRRRLRELAKVADELQGNPDNKLKGVTTLARQLLDDDHSPIIFCRFIDTAEYVADHLAKSFGGKVEVMAITGRIPPAEREERIALLAEEPKRVLVATDCLSEGINLQDSFTAVVHYDLPWNPTRLEQREGRVDRFGQRAEVVRVVTYHGSDNVIDPAVLRVLVEKHRAIRRDLGISIPVPGSTAEVMEAVGQAVLEVGDTGTEQMLAGFEALVAPAAERLVESWDVAADREKASRSLFAQSALKPDFVAGFHESATRALGTNAEVENFVATALKDLGATVIPSKRSTRVEPKELAPSVRHQLQLGERPFAFTAVAPARTAEVLLTRTHPLVSRLADLVLASALDPLATLDVAARSGAMRTSSVDVRTTLLLVRQRFNLTTTKQRSTSELLVEDVGTYAFAGRPSEPAWLATDKALDLLAAIPTENVTPRQASEFLSEVISEKDAWMPHLDADLELAAERLREDHVAARKSAARTAREEESASRSVQVEPLRPLDVLGVFVLLPVVR